ncbi:MAG: hypothetical protein ACPIOQ_08675, partial [Promethearchaeia archaeon]
FLQLEPGALHAVNPAPFTPSPKSCIAVNSTTMHMKRFSLSAAGQPFQYLPGTDACLPMAMAGFDSIGQKPEPVKAVCMDPFLACLLQEGRGSRQAGNKKEDFSARSARNA